MARQPIRESRFEEHEEHMERQALNRSLTILSLMEKGIDTLLREIRTRYGLRQKDLADVAGVAPSTAYRWETGERIPSQIYVARLAEEYPWYGIALHAATRKVMRSTTCEQ